jgi:hypothetical protein
MTLGSGPDAPSRRLCLNCVREPFLRAEIEAAGEEAECCYCEGEGKTFTISQLSERIEAAFAQHFELTPDQPENSYGSDSWYRDGEPVIDAIAGAAGIDEAPASDIAEVLEDRNYDHELAKLGEESPFDSNAHYREKSVDDFHFQVEWSAFEKEIKERARYFSRAAQITLESVFKGIEDLKTDSGMCVVATAGPNCKTTSFYRARVFQSGEALERALSRPEFEIGPPPSRFAAAGRMNAHGIAVFYGASDAETALAEVRPPVGSRVVIGRFLITREIRLLDLTAMRDVFIKGSIFDASYIFRLERAKFLSSLSRRMTRPVMPTDESFDYLPTQAIADYLATDPRLDGIIYRSAQVQGEHTNVVLFHDASRVEPADLPEGTKVTARLEDLGEDGPEPDYTVWEEAPSPPVQPPERKHLIPDLDLYELDEILVGKDPRRSTLRLDLRSIEVHHIDSVSVIATAFPVRRHCIERRG